ALKGRSERVHPLLQLGVSEAAIAVNRSRAGAVSGGATRQEFQRREDRFHDIHLSSGFGGDYISRSRPRPRKVGRDTPTVSSFANRDPSLQFGVPAATEPPFRMTELKRVLRPCYFI